MKVKRKHLVVYDKAGHPFGMDQRDSYWGPFSAWNGERPTFFSALSTALMDSASLYERFRTLPPAFPFPMFGRPSALIDQGAIKFHSDPVLLLACGCKLDSLLLRMRLLAVECESFRTLKEGMETR
jgi:hypothetical protein